MKVKFGTRRSMEECAKIGLIALFGVEYGNSGYAEDLQYYQGEQSIFKAKQLAKHMSKEKGNELVDLIKQSNLKMESVKD